MGFIGPDPTDDFSFTLSQVSHRESYSLLSEQGVQEILADRLDLFPSSQVPKLAHHLVGLCKKYRFDPAFILSLIHVESSFRTQVVSPMGAIGLMQLMPATAHTVIRENDALRVELGLEKQKLTERILKDPFINITLGITYLASLRDRYRNMPPYYLVTAYNVGPGRLDELLSQKSFKPVMTRKYYEAIRRGVPEFRFYKKITSEKEA